MKIKLTVFFTVFFFVFIILDYFIGFEKYIPNYYILVLNSWILLYAFDVIGDRKKIKNTPKNEMRINSNNDNYFAVLPFIIGVIIVFVSCILFLVNKNFTLTIILFIAGIANILRGIYFIPSALIRKEDSQLYLENGKVKKNIPHEQIESINCSSREIKFILKDETSYIFSHLELNEMTITKINDFINTSQ
jgi:hypothetical protein